MRPAIYLSDPGANIVFEGGQKHILTFDRHNVKFESLKYTAIIALWERRMRKQFR